MDGATPLKTATSPQGGRTVDVWTALVPLVIASAIVPVQVVITIILLRSSLATATAWVAGMAGTRVVQGILFGLVFSRVTTSMSRDTGPGTAASILMLILALLLYVTAARTAIAEDDADAPPPKWMARLEGMSARSAFGIGAGYVAISPKFWVFTLGAISVIADSDLGGTASIVTFLVFVGLTLSANLAMLAFAALSPSRSAVVLGRFGGWLEDKNRVITIVLGVVFGTWFLTKALAGFGLL